MAVRFTFGVALYGGEVGGDFTAAKDFLKGVGAKFNPNGKVWQLFSVDKMALINKAAAARLPIEFEDAEGLRVEGVAEGDNYKVTTRYGGQSKSVTFGPDGQAITSRL